MNNGCSGAYEAPQVEILKIAVEKGFAVSCVNVAPFDALCFKSSISKIKLSK